MNAQNECSQPIAALPRRIHCDNIFQHGFSAGDSKQHGHKKRLTELSSFMQMRSVTTTVNAGSDGHVIWRMISLGTAVESTTATWRPPEM